MEVFPHAWMFFIPFIGVIVSAMQSFTNAATVSAVDDCARLHRGRPVRGDAGVVDGFYPVTTVELSSISSF